MGSELWIKRSEGTSRNSLISRVAKAKLDDPHIYLQFIQRVEQVSAGVVRVAPHKKDPCSGVYSRDFKVAREKY